MLLPHELQVRRQHLRPENSHLTHFLDNALKAQFLFHRAAPATLDESAAATVVAETLGEHAAVAAMVGADVPGDLHPAAARERIHGTWVEWLSEVVAHDAMVLVVEDLHWAHDDLLDLVERTVLETTGPLLVIATARPELLARRPGFGMRARDTAIMRVQALGDADTLRLIDALLDGAAGDELSQLVLARAEGNPFFVEEPIAVLSKGAPSSAPTPACASTAARPPGGRRHDPRRPASRIDLLPPDAKQVLRAAAVAGRRFPARAIEVLVPGAHAVLPLLVRREFPRARDPRRGRAVRVQARAHPRRGVRRSDEGSAFGSRCISTTPGGSSMNTATTTRRSSPITTARPPRSRTPTSSGPDAPPSMRGCACLAAFWLEQAARMAYRRGAVQERANLLEHAVRCSRTPRAKPARSARSRTRTRSSTTAKDSSEYWSRPPNSPTTPPSAAS